MKVNRNQGKNSVLASLYTVFGITITVYNIFFPSQGIRLIGIEPS